MGKWLGIGVFVVCVLLGLLIVPIALGLSQLNMGDDCATDSTGSSNVSVKGVPSKFIPIYQKAADKFNLGPDGASYLAAIHYRETNFSTNVATNGPYVGPMAIGSEYWDTYGQDGNGDGKKDIMNDADAIYAAADILSQAGAPGNWHDAIFSYNHAEWYVNEVTDFAKKHKIPALKSSFFLLPSVAKAAGGGKNYLIGDSIGVGLKPELGSWNVEATGGITLPNSFPALEQDADKIRNADNVVVELGTNISTNFESDAKKMVQKIKDINPNATIYWVEIFSNGDYASENAAIKKAVGADHVIQTKGENIPLADGIHPNPQGYKQLAGIIEKAVKTGTSSGGGGGSGRNSEDCDDSSDVSGGTVSGNVQELAEQILDSGNASFAYDTVSSNGSTEEQLKRLASGKKAQTTCPSVGTHDVNVNPNILKFLVEATKKGKVGINALTDKCHSGGSNHYKGTAVDLDLNSAVSADTLIEIAKKYGGVRNSEGSHYHFDFQ